MGRGREKPEKIVAEKVAGGQKTEQCRVFEGQAKENFKEVGGEDQGRIKESEDHKEAFRCGN